MLNHKSFKRTIGDLYRQLRYVKNEFISFTRKESGEISAPFQSNLIFRATIESLHIDINIDTLEIIELIKCVKAQLNSN
jgi:hypothetical protein